MKRGLPYLLLLLLPSMLFPGALPGSDVVSADDHFSVHHVFQDVAGGRVAHPQLSDPALQFAALRKRVVAALSRGEAPLWNPDIWTGAPLLGDGQSMAGSPVTWAHLLFAPDTAQDVGVAWILLWTAFGTALLAGRLGAGRWGACTAGAAAMTGPFTSVWLLHPHAATFAWLPWVLWGLERRSRVVVSLAVAGLLAGGHLQTAAHGIGIILVWAAWRRQWRDVVFGIAAGACLAAPLWLPFVEEVLRSASVSAHGGNRLALGQLLGLVWPGWHGHPAAETWTARSWVWTDGRLHPGLGVLALAALAMWRNRRPARGLVLAWVVCVIIACTGFVGPINHARLGSIGAWFLAVAAGVGVHALGPRWRALGMVAVVLTGAWAVRWDQGTLHAEDHAPAPAAWTQRLRAELGCDPATGPPSDCGRLVGLGWAVQPNTGALAGLPDVRGYDLPVSADTERLMGALRMPPSRPWFALDRLPPAGLLRWAAVRAVVSPEPISGLPAIDLGVAPVFAYRLPGPSPRAWLATAPIGVATPEAAIQRLAQASPARPPVERLVGEWPDTGDVHPVVMAMDHANELVLHTDAPLPGVLVVSDAWHPGWIATLDNAPIPSLRVGGVFRGVAVPAGAHVVRWHFAPQGWRFGKWMFLLGLAILAWGALSRKLFERK